MTGDYTTGFLCAFCGRATDDDPRRVRLSLAFAHAAETTQELGAHWTCLKARLDPFTADALHDPSTDR